MARRFDSDRNWKIAVSRLSDRWTAADEGLVERAARRALALAAPRRELEVSVALADDGTVRTLNRDYRRQDRPTNVLSFESGEEEPGGVLILGDVVLARETCAREAAETGRPFADHLTHLTVHGILHLLGYDHIAEAEAEEMETLEVRILAGMGIENPYLEGTALKGTVPKGTAATGAAAG